MPDHLSPLTLSAYRHGRLDPTETLATSDHLASCADCRRALVETGDGPAYEQLADAADGLLDPAARELLDARLADSPAAAAELDDLKQFKREMFPQSGRVYRPGNHPSPTWWARRWQPLAAAAIILLAAGAWPLHTRRTVPESHLLLTDPSGQPADLTALPNDLRAGVERALREGRVEAPAPDPGLDVHSGRLAGPDASASKGGFRPLAPTAGTVRETRPELRWSPLSSATAYVVTVAAVDGTDTRTSPALPGAQTAWSPPEPLHSGVIYGWQVEARNGADTLAYAPAPPAAEARFAVLSEARRAELVQTEARAGRFPLVMAVAFARDGLEKEAAAQLAILEKEHPGSPLAERLRRQFPSPITTKGAQ